MVSRTGSYYGEAFMGAREVTQVDTLSPTIFNVVVDLVVRHWLAVMVEGAEDWGKRGQEGRHQTTLFYVGDGMVASLDPQLLQGAFSALVGMFDRVGMRTNSGKTFDMVCRPCNAAGTQSESAYGQRMAVEEHTYRERQKGQVPRRECGVDMAEVSLAGHRMTHHERSVEERWSCKTSSTGEDPRMYHMAFSAKGVPWSCLAEGCPGRAATRKAMRVHVLHRNFLYTMVLLEERNIPHPWCPRCDMLVPWRTLNGRQPATAQCARGSEWKRWRLEEEELRWITERAFEAYGATL